MKSISIFSLVFAMICTSIFGDSVKAAEIELKWKDTVDENGYPMQVLDMTDEEIEMYQIAQLKKKYEANNMQRSSGYTYIYERVRTIYDSGSEPTSKILIGKTMPWGTRNVINVSKTVAFTLKGSYAYLEGAVSVTATTEESYDTDDTWDNCLGLFGRITTTRYKVTKKDKYTGEEISVTYEDTMTTTNKSIRVIYNKTGSAITYEYDNSWHTAKMLDPSMTAVPMSNGHIVNATTTVFN